MNERRMTLKALRVNAGMTQVEAATKLGISEETLGNWEKGKTFPNVKDLQKIEILYSIPYSGINFFCDENTDKP